jgi:hypothetical protein
MKENTSMLTGAYTSQDDPNHPAHGMLSLFNLKPFPSQWQLHTWFDYNPETGYLIWKVKPGNGVQIGHAAGSLHSANRHWRIRINGIDYPAHMLVWIYVHGVRPLKLDHLNKDKSDNRISNLRECN